jgi:hypothetical protein
MTCYDKLNAIPLNHFLRADLSSPERLFAPGLGDVEAGMLEEDARSVAIG